MLTIAQKNVLTADILEIMNFSLNSQFLSCEKHKNVIYICVIFTN